MISQFFSVWIIDFGRSNFNAGGEADLIRLHGFQIHQDNLLCFNKSGETDDLDELFFGLILNEFFLIGLHISNEINVGYLSVEVRLVVGLTVFELKATASTWSNNKWVTHFERIYSEGIWSSWTKVSKFKTLFDLMKAF